jgi:hypothetical protein
MCQRLRDLRPQPGAADRKKFPALDRAEHTAAQDPRRALCAVLPPSYRLARTDEALETFGNPLLAVAG